MDPEDQMPLPVEETEEWKGWTERALVREPIFVDALNHHELVLNYPGAELVRNTEPDRA